MPSYEALILGGGPAGASAALYLTRAAVSTAVIENGPLALAGAGLIANYYGITASGKELYAAGLAQAKAAGAHIIHAEALGAEYSGNFTLKLKGENEGLSAPVLILATGSRKKAPFLTGLTEFTGKGVSYCAVCDGFFYRRRRVCVLGSGPFALSEAEYLKNLAASVTVLTDGEAGAAAEGTDLPVITKKLKALEGDNKLEKIIFGDDTSMAADGLFIALGSADSADIARRLGAALNGSYIKADAGGATNIPGLYAAGDCRGGLMQVAKAVCEGAAAALGAIRYLRAR